jgi:enamine deaminase RidA (YjgF/YER057c/UK114 family)
VSAAGRPGGGAGLAAPRGYANGMIATGRTLYVAGQIGWDAAGVFHSDDLIAQFDQALANVIAVVDRRRRNGRRRSRR